MVEKKARKNRETLAEKRYVLNLRFLACNNTILSVSERDSITAHLHQNTVKISGFFVEGDNWFDLSLHSSAPAAELVTFCVYTQKELLQDSSLINYEDQPLISVCNQGCFRSVLRHWQILTKIPRRNDNYYQKMSWNDSNKSWSIS